MFLQETQIQGAVFGRVSMFASISQENGFLFVNQIWHFKMFNPYFQPYKIRFRLLPGLKTNLQKTRIQREGFGRVSTFAQLSQKNGFVFVNQIWHFKVLNHYFQAHQSQFGLMTDFKTNLQETQIQGEVQEEFQRSPRFRRKMMLHLSTKFDISRPWIIIPNVLRFD